MEEILVVDGYNMIGAWPNLRDLKEKERLEEARERLIEILGEYQSISGRRVLLVFDAHKTSGREKKMSRNRIDIIFTGEKETADEWIERYVKRMKNRRNQIFVATSDQLEQHVTFGGGGLRISARELYHEVKKGKERVEEMIRKNEESPLPGKKVGERLHPDIARLFEKYRRE